MREYARGFAIVLCAACASHPGSANDPPLGGANTVTGQVVDFQTNQPIGLTPVMSALGLPDVTVDVSGAAFTIMDVPDNSLFQLFASAPPTWAPTYSPALTVTTMDVTDARAFAVAQTFVDSAASGFGVTVAPSSGVLLVQLVDGTGAPKAGVAGSNLVLSGATGASGPHFFDANLAPSTATSSSSSGWAVFYNVPVGSIALAQPAGATVTLAMAESPIAPQTVTVASVQVTAGATPPPTNVSFSQQVVPIFTSRGCVECHSGNKVGANLGNLSLDGGTNHVYGQLVTTSYPLRVVTTAPATSKVLTMPSYSNPTNGHPVVVFTGPSDKDYQTILAWIMEGAKNN